MATPRQRIEAAANSAQQKEQQRASANEDSMMSAYMRRMFGIGARSPARNTAEAWGRAAQTFLLPLIMQGAQTWKENYDARGDFKAGGADYLAAMLRGEKLNPYQQSVLDNYQKKYPEEYAAAMQQAQQAVQQGAQQAPPPTEGINRDSINRSLFGAINTPVPQEGKNTPSAFDFPYTGEDLAKSASSAQDLMAEMFRQKELEELLNPNNRIFFQRG